MSTAPEVLAAPPENAAPRFDRRAATRGGILAVLDQMAVSGTNFLTGILVGRTCGQEEFGYYSLGVTLLVLLASVQESLVTIPYTMFRARLRGRRRDEYAGRVLVQQSALALLATAGLALLAMLCGGNYGALAWVVAAVVPPVLLREFCRRLGFAHDRIAGVLALDLAVAALQLGALARLASQGWLTASLAFAAVGLVCGIVAVACLILVRADIALRRRRVGREIGRHWTFGRWVAAGQLVGVVHGYAIHWLLVLMIGPAATGVFTACMTVLLLSNPVVLALGNLLGPWTARARAEGGGPAVRRVVVRSALGLSAVVGAFCGVIAVAGSAVVEVLYGPGYAGHELTLIALAVAFAAAPAGIAADHGLRALGRPRVAFTGSVIGLAVTTAGAALLIPHLGIAGAACGYLMGAVASTAVRLVAFLRLSASGAARGRA